ncbi:hypothetical protein FZEAL_8042 [Fusarium zealandicum]|uniref:DUF4246 domain-containing protein n=1 Tax=Fusarium zealandicum TaxID=1053134 RepID=A0A8H4UEW3_9HYPO|nr:hypothetical protein FZEAL_8042 [Fusarium zealandicum]
MELSARTILFLRLQDQEIWLPGFGQYHLTHLDHDIFTILLGDEEGGWKAATLTTREVCMLKCVQDITNKPEWWQKINGPEIADRGATEAVDMPWSEYREHAGFTMAMAVASNNELTKKTEIYQETGLIPVMDYSMCAIKSDKLVP